MNSDLSPNEKGAVVFASSPVLQGLWIAACAALGLRDPLLGVAAAGAGELVSAAIVQAGQQIRTDRLLEFLKEVGRGEGVLEPRRVQGDDFLHCFFATAEAATR